MAILGTCSCQGLVLMRQVVNILELFTSSGNPNLSESTVKQNVQEAKTQAVKVGRHILRHLEAADKEADESLRADVKRDLEYIRQQNNLLQHADEPMLYFDNIRDRIHKADPVKQLLVCGSGPELSMEAQVVKDVSQKCGGDEVEEAGVMLDEIISAICTTE